MSEKDIHDTAENQAENRWIRVDVAVFNHPAFDEVYDRRSAWLWLIANAAWKPHRCRVGNAMMEIERGQVIAGRQHLAKTWGWGEKKVRLFLDFLASENMIERGQSRGRLANLITICNYERYQKPKVVEGPVEGPVQGRFRAGSGPYSTKDTKITNKDSTASILCGEDIARAENEISGLNGATATCVAKLAGWLNPMMPDRETAIRILTSNTGLYGGEAVKTAVADLETKIAGNEVVANPLKAFTAFCQQASRRGKARTTNPWQAEREAEHAKIQGYLAEIDKQVAGGVQ